MKRNHPLESARRVLWTDRECLLPHLLEHRSCGVYAAVEALTEIAGWTMDSYVLAAMFDSEELLTEVTK